MVGFDKVVLLLQSRYIIVIIDYTHMQQKNIVVVVAVAFLLGFVMGATLSRYIGFPVSFINDGCPYGMREHFDEMSGRSNCVPEDYIGI